METCPKCSSAQIARDLRFFLPGASNDGSLPVGKMFERPVNFWTVNTLPITVQANLRVEICTDCGHAEFSAPNYYGDRKELLKQKTLHNTPKPRQSILQPILLVVIICLVAGLAIWLGLQYSP